MCMKSVLSNIGVSDDVWYSFRTVLTDFDPFVHSNMFFGIRLVVNHMPIDINEY